MPIEGELKELSLPDFLQILTMNRKTGVLELETTQKTADVYIYQGNIKFITLRNSEDFFTTIEKAGILSPDNKKEIEQFKTDESRIFKIIAKEKKEYSQRIILPFLEKRMFELLQWREGKFRFIEKDIGKDFDIPLPLSTQDLILESSRKIDEWSEIYRKLPSLEVVPFLSDEWLEKGTSTLSLSPLEWKILSMVDGKKKVFQIMSELQGNTIEVAKMIGQLVESGILKVREVKKFEEELRKKKAEEFFLKSREFEKKRMYSEAEAMAVRALSLNPDFLMAHLFLGDLYYIQKQYRLAAQEYYEVVKRDPKNPLGYYNLGYVRLHFGDLLGTLKVWEKAYTLATGKMKKDLEEQISLIRKILLVIDSKRFLTHG